MRAAAPALALSDGQRKALEALARSRTALYREVQCARALLLAGEGLANAVIAERVAATAKTVRAWRERFDDEGVAGLGRVRQGRGRKASIPQAKIDEIVELTLHSRPETGARWSCRTMAAATGVSSSQVQRIWAAKGLKPHPAEIPARPTVVEAEQSNTGHYPRLRPTFDETTVPHVKRSRGAKVTTLRDVGVVAGVSTSTVSLVLNGRSAGRVKPHIGDRVRQVAAELGYLPNLMARGLRTNRTQTIGLVSDQVSVAPNAGKMLQGAQEAAWAEGYVLLFVDTAGDSTADSTALRALLQRNMDGLIFASSFHREVTVPVVPTGTPMLLLDARPDDGTEIDWVTPDEVKGGFDAVSLLTAVGHRRIGFLTKQPLVRGAAAVGRYLGFEHALAAADIAIDRSLVVHLRNPAGLRDAHAAAISLLSRPDRPTAIFCFVDEFAAGVYRAAAELGLRIPQDLSVVGFDNDGMLIENFIPGLTTMELPHHAMGQWATRRILQRIGADHPLETSHHLVPCQVVLRNSIAPPPE